MRLNPGLTPFSAAHLWLELPSKEQVSADLVQGVQPVHRLLDAAVQVHNPPGDSIVGHLRRNIEGLDDD